MLPKLRLSPQIDALLAAFTDNQAALEKKLGLERSRMVAVSEAWFRLGGRGGEFDACQCVYEENTVA